MSSAVVIGAGAGGLVAAWELARGGCDVVLLDAWKWPGGLLGRAELEGIPLDVGAEGYSVRGGAVEQLLADLGASELIARPNPGGAWLQTASGAHPIPKRLVFGLPADPDADDVRAVVGELPAPRVASGTLAELAEAGYGRRVLDDLVTPLVGGVYSASPDDVTLAELAPALAAAVASGVPLRQAVTDAATDAPKGGAVHGLRGGMHGLVDLLISSARGTGNFELAVEEPVRELNRRPGGWRVGTSRRELDADLVVLAVPLDVAVRLLGGPVVPATSRIDVVTLVLDAPGLGGEEPRGTGVLVGAEVPGVAAKALTHSTAKWAWLRETAGGREVLRLSYGRRGQPPATAGLDADALAALVRADASVLLGRPVPEPVAVRRTGWSILPPGTPGLADAREWLTEQRTAGLGLAGAGIAGVGLAGVVPQARAEAARLMQSTRSVDE
ncbi:MAG: FAD-dependent oxidoreductase [Micropruina sp.]|uniref:protoporphyrinogen/coproporphyrinogen oxidase n=1 Tax=Micropruina sp. TaxID=2737536 RepID=UPI0039E5011C